MKDTTIIQDWEQITLEQYEEICRLQEHHPDDATRHIVEYLYSVDDAESLPLPQYVAMVAGLRKFADDPIATAKLTPAATYTIEGRQYDVELSPNAFTAGQYIDLTNHIKTTAPLVDVLTVVMAPHGHTYNDGYDMAEVRRDLNTLPVTAAFAVVGFFARWSAASTSTFLRCLTKWTKRTGKVSREQTQQLEEARQQLQRAMEYYPTF